MEKLLEDLKSGQIERLSKNEITKSLNDIKLILEDMEKQKSIVMELQKLLTEQLKVFKKTNGNAN